MMGRYSVQVRGLVQGVVFRPFVHGLATSLGLVGSVQNRTDHVLIEVEVEGNGRSLGRFFRALSAGAPALAMIDEVRREARPPRRDGGRSFVIISALGGQ
jgi:hydrogenase maturation protein HypF